MHHKCVFISIVHHYTLKQKLRAVVISLPVRVSVRAAWLMQQTNIMCCSYSQEYVEPSLSTHTRHTLIYQRRWCCWTSHAPRCHVQMPGSSWLLSAVFEEHACFISVMNPILCLHCLRHDYCLLCLTCCYFITDLFSVAKVMVISSCSAQFGHALPRTNESRALDLWSSVFLVKKTPNVFSDKDSIQNAIVCADLKT